MDLDPARGPIFLLLLALAWVSLWLIPRNLRHSLRDGGRALGSRPVLWRLPMLFAVAYALYALGADWLLAWRIGSPPAFDLPFRLDFDGWQANYRFPSVWTPLPAVGGIFDHLVTVYPVSALFALGYLIDWRGLRSEFGRYARRKLQRLGPWIMPAFLAAAVAALLRPGLQLFLPEIESFLGAGFAAWVVPISFLAFAFEFPAAVGLQTFLILGAFLWSRGILASQTRLLRLTAHRMVFVLRYAVLVYALYLLLGIVPGWVLAVLGQSAPVPGHAFSPFVWLQSAAFLISFGLSALFVLLFSVQVRLVLTNRSLRQAVRDHFRALRRSPRLWGGFLLFVYLTFYLVDAGLAVLDALLVDAAPGWRFLLMTVRNLAVIAVGSWLLAAWVIFFRRAEGRFRELL